MCKSRSVCSRTATLFSLKIIQLLKANLLNRNQELKEDVRDPTMTVVNGTYTEPSPYEGSSNAVYTVGSHGSHLSASTSAHAAPAASTAAVGTASGSGQQAATASLPAPSTVVTEPPCAACKSLRRKCTRDCIFLPYFPRDDPEKFARVHKVFGASNVSKMLQELPAHQREDAVASLEYEAQARVQDPVYGCVGILCVLQRQVASLRAQLAIAQSQASPGISSPGDLVQVSSHPNQHTSSPTPPHSGPHSSSGGRGDGS